ncbi:troponin I, fast skeletal muscle-like, partial [Scleropages formosus]
SSPPLDLSSSPPSASLLAFKLTSASLARGARRKVRMRSANVHSRVTIRSLMLSVAKGLLEQEAKDREEERNRYMAESCPPLSLSGGLQELQELCKQLHQKIDKIDEERYDLESKVNKNANEIEDMKFKVIDLKGKFKKPALRKPLEAVGDWRKNIEDKAGMDGRKKIKKMSSSRKHTLKNVMLQLARELLDREATDRVEEKKQYMEERCPPLVLPNSLEELQNLCRELHEKIEMVNEDKYDLERKIEMFCNEVKELNFKVIDLQGKFKKPPLKKDKDVGDWRKNIEDKAGMGGRKKIFESEA